jgi:N-acetylglutamate synthase-like GNAT family acetyltransferase
MIRECKESDFNNIIEIINDAAQAYKGIIPQDRWHEPYMSLAELRAQKRGIGEKLLHHLQSMTKKE